MQGAGIVLSKQPRAPGGWNEAPKAAQKAQLPLPAPAAVHPRQLQPPVRQGVAIRHLLPLLLLLSLLALLLLLPLLLLQALLLVQTFPPPEPLLRAAAVSPRAGAAGAQEEHCLPLQVDLYDFVVPLILNATCRPVLQACGALSDPGWLLPLAR